mmetsp:Transcript_3512/g.8190  ORF Transcript_3512/g.8190 Transcript_3512/m.8190 type:complete len:255 (+) Transcript_3512:56-820(+)
MHHHAAISNEHQFLILTAEVASLLDCEQLIISFKPFSSLHSISEGLLQPGTHQRHRFKLSTHHDLRRRFRIQRQQHRTAVLRGHCAAASVGPEDRARGARGARGQLRQQGAMCHAARCGLIVREQSLEALHCEGSTGTLNVHCAIFLPLDTHARKDSCIGAFLLSGLIYPGFGLDPEGVGQVSLTHNAGLRRFRPPGFPLLDGFDGFQDQFWEELPDLLKELLGGLPFQGDLHTPRQDVLGIVDDVRHDMNAAF